MPSEVDSPVFQGEFQLGVEHRGDVHTSRGLFLSDEDHTSRYLPNVEGLLYLKANMPVTIPVREEGGRVCKVSSSPVSIPIP